MKTKQKIQERIEQIKQAIQDTLESIDTDKMYSDKEAQELRNTIKNVKHEQYALEWVLKEE